MREKDVRVLWEEDGDLELMKLFFLSHRPEHDLQQRIKEKTLAKIAREEEGGHVGATPDHSRPSSGKRWEPFGRWFCGLRWRREWKFVLPLATVMMLGLLGYLVWVGPIGSPDSYGVRNTALAGKAQSALQVPKAASPAADAGAGTGNPELSWSRAGAEKAPPGDAEPGSGGTENQPEQHLFTVTAPYLAALPDPAAGQALSQAQSAVDPNVPGISRKIVKNYWAVLQVESVSTIAKAIEQKAQELHGYVVAAEQNGAQAEANGHVTVRVPAEQLDSLRSVVPSWGKVLSERQSGNDITNQYYDAQTRLQHWQAEEARYLDILRQAKNVDDILKVENSLASIRQQIEQLKGQLKLWDHDVAYSTVDITLQTKPRPTVQIANAWQPMNWHMTWQAAREAVLKTVSSMWNALNYLVIGLGYALPYLGVLAVGFATYRWWRARRS